MDRLFYNIYIRLFPLATALIAPFSNKAKLWIKGRKDVFSAIENAFSANQAPVIWIHCASLGEFEQGRPLLEKLRELYPSYKLLVTFFSPLGYEAQKNNALANHSFYLPMDSHKNAARFLRLVKPSLVILVRYQYWYNYLQQVHAQKIPLLLVSGLFIPGFSFFKWYGALGRQMLHFFTHFFVQTERSKQLLQSINITNVSVAGNTRFDRVLQIAAVHDALPPIEHFINQQTTIVAGSTWTDDDEVLDHFANTHPELRFIIVPRDIGEERLDECLTLYKHSILYSAYLEKFNRNEALPPHINTLIIDNVGLLKSLYYYAAICYVGGGFGNAGVHNILEAAVYYKPVLFGPSYERSAAASDLVDSGGAFDIIDSIELEDQLTELLSDEQLRTEAGTIAGEYVKSKAGATNMITNYLQANGLLQ